LVVAARWTARAWPVARWLDDDRLMGNVLRMHGNELRKCGHHAAAVARLTQSLSMTSEPSDRGATLRLLARAAAEADDTALFDLAIAEARALLEDGHQNTMFFNRFSLDDIHTRGLPATGRVSAAVARAHVAAQQDSGPAIAPQWHVINQVTVGDVLPVDGDVTGAFDTLQAAMAAAETYRLPHQVQRAMRVVGSVPQDAAEALVEAGTAALARLRRLLSAPMASP
jgi:hypothetical protein